MTEGPADDLPLAAGFPAATYEQWRRLAEAVIKGARFEDRLQSRTADGLVIDPLYPRAPEASPIAARKPGARWQVMARVDHPDPAAANAQALEDLAGGANGLVLVGAGAVGAQGFGLLPDAGIEAVLAGVQLDAGIAIEFDLSPQATHLALMFAGLVAKRGVAADAIDFRFGFDPLGAAVFNGGYPDDWQQFGPATARLARELSEAGFKRPLTVADGRIVHGAGGTEAQELAYVVAAAVASLRAFEAGGIALDNARRMIFFRLAADADQFLTVAKFRALRKLWRRIEESCGLVPAPAFVSAETAWRTMTRHDPATNILRATIAAFSAGIGGADAITVIPFTAARGLPDGFARRVARNTQLVILDEAHIARVADPTAGTGWSEHLTDQLCRAAWTLFHEIEAAGGAAAALAAGLIQRKVAAARAELETAVATRRHALIGANEFPDLGETPVAVLDVARASMPPLPVAVPVMPLSQMRLAEPFEALRDRSDRLLDQTGARPKVFLANLGASADFTAPAAFARNIFGSGGIDALDNAGFAHRDAMIAAFKASGASLACLCGSSEAYARQGVAAAKALRAAGVRGLYLAGEPGEREAELRAAG
ncbi:MAG: methylmalonyl-CoA mutase, partial [Alphaproteobacteria bacterium]|nr:methylmalonyl-CoA mutase [Alphaproteobacteria bacterium]